jgi:hypothetical protein
MPSSIERLQPQQGRAISVYQAPLTAITPALRFGTQLRNSGDQGWYGNTVFEHSKGMISYASKGREKLLAKFGLAVSASEVLANVLYANLDRKVATVMVSALLGAFAAKADMDVLTGMLDMLEGNEIADASGLWRSVQTSPAVLALACRKLIASNTFTPKAAELREACREAYCSLLWAFEAAHELVDFTRRCDVLLLEFDHKEWERPYLTPQYRPILAKMLELHRSEGDGSDAWLEWYVGEGKPLPLVSVIQAEQAKLTPPPERKRIAAARKRGHVKHSKTTRQREPKPVEADSSTSS